LNLTKEQIINIIEHDFHQPGFNKDKFIDLILNQGVKCFNCGSHMMETSYTPVGKLPDKVKYPDSTYYIHPRRDNCPVADYVVKVGYKAC